MRSDGTAAFGPFSFDLSRGELRRRGRPVLLAPREADVLGALLAVADTVVLREELLERFWGCAGGAAADARLNSCVRRIRRALGDDAHTPAYVETVHRRGYRFIGHVEWEEGAREGRRGRPFAVTAGGLALLAVAIAAALARPERGATAVPEGWETTYLRARHLATRGSLAEAAEGAELLREVTEAAPRVPGAWSALAVAEARFGGYHRAEAHARRALALDGGSAEGHAVLAQTAVALRWDLEEAEAHVLEAVRLDPRSADAHSTYAFTLALLGRWDQAISEARRALALDPLHTVTASDLAYFLYWARRYDETVAQARRALAVEPDLRPALEALRLGLMALRDPVGAAEPTLRLVELSGDAELARVAARAAPADLQRLWLRWRLRSAAGSTSPDRWVGVAAARAELGDTAGALEALGNAIADHAPGAPMMLVDPRFEGLAVSEEVASLRAAVRGLD